MADDWTFDPVPDPQVVEVNEDALVEKIAQRVVALLDERRLHSPDPVPQTEKQMN